MGWPTTNLTLLVLAASACGGEFRLSTGAHALLGESENTAQRPRKPESLHGVAVDLDATWSDGEQLRFISGWVSSWVPWPSLGGRTLEGLLWWFGPVIGAGLHPGADLSLEVVVGLVNPTYSAFDGADANASTSFFWRASAQRTWVRFDGVDLTAGLQVSRFEVRDERAYDWVTQHLLIGATVGFAFPPGQPITAPPSAPPPATP